MDLNQAIGWLVGLLVIIIIIVVLFKLLDSDTALDFINLTRYYGKE